MTSTATVLVFLSLPPSILSHTFTNNPYPYPVPAAHSSGCRSHKIHPRVQWGLVERRAATALELASDRSSPPLAWIEFAILPSIVGERNGGRVNISGWYIDVVIGFHHRRHGVPRVGIANSNNILPATTSPP